jgi:phosphatidylglycerol:prolipoprotein diacylglycerol transferase
MFIISVNPVAFYIGSFEVRWYGIIIAIAVAVMILWMIRQVDKNRQRIPVSPDIAIAPVGIISGMIGAKLVHVLEQPNYYVQNPVDVFTRGGFGIYGAVIGATLGIWIYLKITRKGENIHFGFFTDLAAPGIILSQAIGRIGCTINGCCHGRPAPDWFPWTLVYTHPNTACALELRGTPLYPTQPAEIIFALVTFVVLLKSRNRLRPIEGSLFMVYLIMYSAWRLGLGFFRTAEVYFLSGIFSQAQIISLVVLGLSIFLLIRMRRRSNRSTSC